ncbi:hypothetical protein HD554DRAFT_2031083 [Boletus coccyginus]|nr:hypothetical protein HD554DRAFT_2031083 [Boletus coccyginus]
MLHIFFSLFVFLSLTIDLRAQNIIHNYHPNYIVTAYMWPLFLYAKGQYDPENLTNGLFKAELLVKICSKHFYRSQLLYSFCF